MRIRAIHSDTPTYYMEGTANYVGGGTLIITVDKFNGSGSHNLWNFSVSGEVGQTGATGSSGVVSVTSPITNSGTSSSAIVGIDQTLLSITRSQVSDFTSGTVTFATTSGTAVYATTSGTATYATTSGTAVNISGTVTQAQVTSLTTDLANRAKLDTANTFTVGGHIISNAATAVVPLVVKGASGQSANLQEWQSSTGSTALSVNSAGLVTATRQLSINSGAAGETLFVARGAASQTGDTIAVRDSSANTIAGFSATGRLYTGVSGSGQTYLGGLNLGAVNTVATQLGVIAGASTTVGAVIRGAASQSANLQEWQNSGGTVLASISSAGASNFASVVATGTSRAGAGLGSSSVALSTLVSNVTAGHLVIQNTGTVPATPSTAGVLYVESGVLKYKGSSGTITTLGAA
jgi:hypothetical protein